MSLAGKAAVITGGGRGIGAATARALAGAGARVLVAARSASELESVVADLVARGHEAHWATCDVTSEESVRALAERAGAELGAVDVLVNNAGIGFSAPVRSMALADWNRVLAVNATGTFLVTRAFLGGMAERRWGRVINVASTAARAGAPYIAAYAASKHAVLGLTRCAALEVAREGVTVNAVCPGYVDTKMTRDSLSRILEKTKIGEERAMEAVLATSPQRRLIRPEEVAELVVWLAGDAAAGVNGQALVLDGGGVQA